jgi:transcriptional regulator with XRE-family HTH domain
MILAERLRSLREAKKLSQGDIEKKTGLLRCYISRVENGHTVPAIETLEKMARAMDVPLFMLFVAGDEEPKLNGKPVRAISGQRQPDVPMRRLQFAWPKLDAADKTLVVKLATKLAAA